MCIIHAWLRIAQQKNCYDCDGFITISSPFSINKSYLGCVCFSFKKNRCFFEEVKLPIQISIGENRT